MTAQNIPRTFKVTRDTQNTLTIVQHDLLGKQVITVPIEEVELLQMDLCAALAAEPGEPKRDLRLVKDRTGRVTGVRG